MRLAAPAPSIRSARFGGDHAIDAAAVGMLVFLQNWANTISTPLKLMNLTPRTEALLELLNLRIAFDICSVPAMLGLLCCAFAHSQMEGVQRKALVAL